MCCFSGEVQEVSNTQIFARPQGNKQVIVYSLKLSAKDDLAMVLPIPVPAKSAEDAVRFVNLEEYPELFKDLDQGFPQLPAQKLLDRSKRHLAEGQEQLEVVRVGAYEASFVPGLADFSRLDARFRVPDAAWRQLPQYADWGFAVFKLRKGTQQEVHPMAFWFPTRHPDRVFFPTVHIHDGTAPKEARFDHALYCQLPTTGLMMARDPGFATNWRESDQPAQFFVDMKKAGKLIQGADHVYRRFVRETRKNEDVVLSLA